MLLIEAQAKEIEALRSENEALRRYKPPVPEGRPPLLRSLARENYHRPTCPQGFPLGMLMEDMNACCLVVSTPEHGPKESGGPPYDDVPVMSSLERLSNYRYAKSYSCYDFMGSSSGMEMDSKAKTAL